MPSLTTALASGETSPIANTLLDTMSNQLLCDGHAEKGEAKQMVTGSVMLSRVSSYATHTPR